MTAIATERVSAGPVDALTLVVAAREDVAESVVALTLVAPDCQPLPSWSPGAHVDLLLKPGLIRQYSLCGDPADAYTWRVAVLLDRAGRGGSGAVHGELLEGALVAVRGPRNNFPLIASPRYLFIAGGIGITPILPMILRAELDGAEWTLVYGGRHRGSMAFLPELARYGERVRVRPENEVGLLDLDALLGQSHQDVLIYCCGPEALLSAVEQRCTRWPEGSLHVERFKAAPATGKSARGTFRVVFERSGVAAEVGPGQTIVEVADEAGVLVSSSCREGVCGTCEVAVLAGQPDHRDFVLDAGERAAGKTMMACVSRSTSSELRLDL
jgi:ferredoxin-NADP reductase